MDKTTSTLLSLEAMGSPWISGTSETRGQQGSCLEHSEISTWPVAIKPQSGSGLCIAREVLFESGVTEAVC